MATYGYLVHYGIKGQRWGIRRYQNPDGSLTEEGRRRYGYGVIKDKKTASELYKKGSYVNEKIKSGMRNRAADSLEEYNALRKNAIESESEDMRSHFAKPETKSKFIKYMNEQFGSPEQVDDEDIAKYAAQDWFNRELDVSKSAKTKSAWNEANDFGSITTERQLNKYVDDIVGEYSNYSPSLLKPSVKQKVTSMMTEILQDLDHKNALELMKEDHVSEPSRIARNYYDSWKNQKRIAEVKEANRKAAQKGRELANKSNFSFSKIAQNVINSNSAYRTEQKVFSWEQAEEELLRNYKNYIDLPDEDRSALMSSVIEELEKKGYTLMD